MYAIRSYYEPGCGGAACFCEAAVCDRLPACCTDAWEQGCILVNIVDEDVFRWLDEHRVPFVVQNFTQYEKARLVITSYSIHYTKLYESMTRSRGK